MSDREGPAKILVVDDAPQNVRLLRAILTSAGYRVVEAASGQEGLEKLASEMPDAVLLDVRMPGMSGYTICRSIRQQRAYATLPVILVTALAVPEERIRGIQAGATDFITKPFNKRELLARIETSLRLARIEHDGILDQLEGSVILAKPNWHIIGLSPLAAEILADPRGTFVDVNLIELLQGYRIEPDFSDLAIASTGASFRLRSVVSPLVRSGWYTPVADADRTLLFRVLNFDVPS